jgi:hypothetical protein
LEVLLPVETCSSAELLRQLLVTASGADDALLVVLDVDALGLALTRRDLLPAASFHVLSGEQALVMRSPDGRVAVMAASKGELRALGATAHTLSDFAAELGDAIALVNLPT